MKLPFDRERMRERNLLDDIDEIEQAARQTPSERFAAGLALSDLAIAMFRGNPDAPVLDRLEDLEEKARLWAAPLRLSLLLSASASAAGAASAAGTATAAGAASAETAAGGSREWPAVARTG